MSVNNRLGTTLPTSTYLKVTQTTQVQPDAATAVQSSKKAAAVNLFDASSYQKAVSVTDSSGQTLSLPTLSDEEVAQVQTLFKDVPDAQKEAINAASSQLGQALFSQMLQSAPAQVTTDDDGQVTGISGGASLPSTAASTATTAAAAAATGVTQRTGAAAANFKVLAVGASADANLSAGATTAGVSKAATASTASATTASDTVPVVGSISSAAASPAVVSATQNAASTYSSATGAEGSNAVMATAYMGVVGLQGQMSDFASSMQDTLSQKKSIDSDYQELQQAVADWPDGTDTQVLPKVVTNDDGTVSVTQEAQTKAEAQASADAAKDASTNLGSDNQMQMIQMQYIQQQYSNAVTGISNIMKVSYDTTKNTLGNVHY